PSAAQSVAPISVAGAGSPAVTSGGPGQSADAPAASLPEGSVTPSFSAPSTAPDASASVGPEVPSSPSPERLALLQPCPDQPDCYTYVIQKGDSLLSLAKYFGVP